MENNLNEVLLEAKNLLKGEISELSYKTWILPLELSIIEDNNVILISDDPFKKESVESRFKDLLENAFSIILQKKCNISIILKDSNDTQEKNTNFSNNINYSKTYLNPDYSFDTFVVGDNNRFAHAAALAVAESPATAYNPLFIYGGVGLGKTHLLHAIGNEILKNHKDFKILYVTSEKFTNEFINSLRFNSMDEFRNKYRNIDLLLIDDIQFIAGKDRLQEEFFHTFNTLRESGKQIVLSSDKPPRDIPLLEDRLKSRFEWGILADVAMADYEVRLAILRKKADEKHAIIDDDILKNIAAKIDSNIRELEGVLNKMIAKASLTHSPLTMEMAEKAINDIVSQKEKIVSPEYIQEVVAKYFNLNPKDLKSSKRSNDLAYPRQIAMYLCRDIAQMQLAKIGDSFGKRDHTTVMHACRKIESEIKENGNTKLIVDSVKNLILNSN